MFPLDQIKRAKPAVDLDHLPDIAAERVELNTSAVSIGDPQEIEPGQLDRLENFARGLGPWRKGPFKLFGRLVDAEWRSDIKWDRMKKALGDLRGRRVLDVGCNNGYFMFRAAGAGAQSVLGLDPVVPFESQFRLFQRFARQKNIHFALAGLERLHFFKETFDVILYLGVIYHHPDPIGQLKAVRGALRPGGEVFIESLGLAGEEPHALIPPGRYANMRNVHAVPTMGALKAWALRAGFSKIEEVFSCPADSREQRTGAWNPPGHRSFKDFLDPADNTRTMEGHPAPRRLCLKAGK